jgi:hypothetical protein
MSKQQAALAAGPATDRRWISVRIAARTRCANATCLTRRTKASRFREAFRMIWEKEFQLRQGTLCSIQRQSGKRLCSWPYMDCFPLKLRVSHHPAIRASLVRGKAGFLAGVRSAQLRSPSRRRITKRASKDGPAHA